MDVLLSLLVEGQDLWGSVLDLARENRVSPVDECEMRFSHRLGGGGADGPYYRGELVDPVLAAILETVEASCLESLEHLSICLLGLPVASWVSYRGETEPCAQLFVVCPEEATGELRAIFGDDAVGHSKAVGYAPDEFDS